ncbi:MAG: ATP-binding cassette domain-containing protein [Candidatus Cloacimonetes bacterium]|nr:ATP-binding cassette domain-containing protein [Candidatus Cloacimonadota bacterium]
MSIVTLINLSHSFGGQNVFRNLNFSIEKNSRMGLVGRNGSGKSTLFNIITGRLQPGEGTVLTAKNLRIAYLTQEPELDPEQAFYDCILSSRPEYLQLSHQIEVWEQQLEKGNSKPDLEFYSQLREKFEDSGGYALHNEISTILSHLDFPRNVWQRKVSTFSGGEKTRIQLAKFLIQPYDVMLLDEPTNHLDLNMIFWLEKYLKNINRPYVIVSHDRNFLDNTISKIAELERGTITIFKSNYSNYHQEKIKRREVQVREFKRQQKLIAETEDFIRRNMAGQKVLQAKSRQKMLQKLNLIDKPLQETTVNMTLESEKRSGNEVYVFEDVSFGYAGSELAHGLNLQINYQDKIALLGRNGCGKSTFFRLLNQEVAPLHGHIKKGASLKIGYYDQEHIRLNNNLTVFETIRSLVPEVEKGYVLSYLARFGFQGDDVEKTVSILSGGEKSRLYLARLIHEKPNFLILDEPTNHLDITMIDSLEEALCEYDGTVIFISHDRYFIEKIASRKWFFQHKRIIETDKGLAELFSERIKDFKEKTCQKRKDTPGRINPLILDRMLDEINALEKDIHTKERELQELEMQYTDKKIYQNESMIKELTRKIQVAREEKMQLHTSLENLENKYLDLVDLEVSS